MHKLYKHVFIKTNIQTNVLYLTKEHINCSNTYIKNKIKHNIMSNAYSIITRIKILYNIFKDTEKSHCHTAVW